MPKTQVCTLRAKWWIVFRKKKKRKKIWRWITKQMGPQNECLQFYLRRSFWRQDWQISGQYVWPHRKSWGFGIHQTGIRIVTFLPMVSLRTNGFMSLNIIFMTYAFIKTSINHWFSNYALQSPRIFSRVALCTLGSNTFIRFISSNDLPCKIKIWA